MISKHPVTDDVHFDHSIKVVFARLLYWKDILLPLNKYSVGKYINISFLIKLSMYSIIYIFMDL